MRILYVVKSLSQANGVASYVMNYYRKLRYENVKMDFLIIKGGISTYYQEIENDGNNIYILPSYKKNIIKVYLYLNNLFKNGQYDIIHCNTVNSGSLILKLAKKNNIKIRILHSHATQNADTFFKRIIRSFFKKIAIRNASVYFACSEKAGVSLFKNNKFTIIPNAINIDKFSFNKRLRETIREKEKIFDNELVIMTVGRITKQKNPFFIVDIIKKLIEQDYNIKLWWFGNGDLEEKIKEYIDKKGVKDKIKLFGSITNVNEFCSAADIFILPSLYEGLPGAGIEAQISGLTTLFSDNITREAKISNECFFLGIDSADVWKEKIVEIRNYDREKNINSLNKKNYDINFQYKNMLNEYRSLIEKNK